MAWLGQRHTERSKALIGANTSRSLVGRRREGTNRWRGKAIKYRAAHMRLIRYEGQARDRQCAHCIQPARDWAWRHDASERLFDEDGHGPFSTQPSDYIPLCSSCHNAYDGRGRGAGPEARRQLLHRRRGRRGDDFHIKVVQG